MTAAQRAVELEVSVSTARRDLEALSTAGIPIYLYPQAARRGGWQPVLETAIVQRRRARVRYAAWNREPVEAGPSTWT